MAECDALDKWVGCKIGNAVGSVVDSGASSLGDSMMEGWDEITRSFLTSWLKVGVLVDLDAGSVQWLTAQLEVISVFLAVIGLMVAALWTMVHYRGEKAIKVAKSLFTVMLVTTVGVGLIQAVLTGGDAFSDWVLDSAGVTLESQALEVQRLVVGKFPGLAVLAGIFGIIATIIQWGIMLVRSALLPLLIGVWPAAAAAAMIGGAEQAFSKITTWIIAFALYKSVAAIVYAYAWKTKSGAEGIGGIINGLVLIVLAVVALPAMMRLLAPGTAALGGSGGGSMALAGVAALVGAGVAAGTAVLTGGGSAVAGGAAATAGTAKGASAAGSGPSMAGGTGAAGPSGTDGGSSAGGSEPAGTVGGSGSGGTGSGTVGGDPASGGTGAQAIGAAGAANGAGSTGSGTVSGDAAAGGTGAGTMGSDGAAEGASPPPSADVGSSGSAGSAGMAAGASAPSGAPEPMGASGNTNNQPSRTRQAGGAAARSMGQAVADGAKDADGKDVIGE